MAFGADLAKNAEKEKLEYSEKMINEDSKKSTEKDYLHSGHTNVDYDNGADPFTQGEKAQPQNNQRRFSRSKVENESPQNGTSPSTINESQPVHHEGRRRPDFKRDSANSASNNNSGSDINLKTDNSNKGAYSPKNVSSASNNQPIKYAANGLDSRLDRLIDIVGDYLDKSQEEIDKIKRQAKRNPDEITREYNRIFRDEIKPKKEKNYKSLEDARREHPDKIILMRIQENGEASMSAMNRENAGSKILYDGVIVKSVPFTRSPFDAPSILFEEAKPKLIASEDSDEAFNDNPSEEPQHKASSPKM